MEPLESRVLLAVTSVSDVGIAFSAVDENLFNNQAGISKNFNYTLLDESFGFTVGGFSEGTGLKASFAGGIELGLNGGFNVGGGTFDVNYLTDVDITTAGVDGSNINSLVAGDHFSITASETPDDTGIAMTSQVTGLDTDLNIVAKIDAGINVKAKFAYKTVIDEGVNWDLAPGNIQVFDIGANLSTGDIDFTIFDTDITAQLDDTDVFNLVDRGIEYNFGSIEGGVYVPQLDTGVSGDGFDDSEWKGDRIVNKHLLPAGFELGFSDTVSRIDYLHLGFDVAEFVLSKVPVSPVGIPTEFPELELTNDIKLTDFHIIDGILSTHFGIGQKLTFEPELMVDLTFTDELGEAKTTFVETFAGSGNFTAVTSKRIEAGTTVEIIHSGGELNIDTDYVLSGTFYNETKLYITPAFDLNVLDGIVEVDLNRFDNLDLFNGNLIFRDHFTAFNQSFAPTGPIAIKNLIDSSVTVGSFAEVDGSDLSLSATPSVDLQAIVGVSELSIVEGETLTASMVISDPNAAADDSDVYEAVIDWQDGATETLTLDKSGSLPAHATYDALNHVLVVSHEYVEDTATQPDPNLSPTTFDATISFQATKLTPGSVNENVTHTDAVVIEVLNVGPDVTIDDLSIDNVGNATLEASYVDQGVQDSHEIVIQNWGDSESTGFDLPDPGSLTIGNTFNATSGSELLTITFVDAATGNVSFTVTGHTYTQVTRGELNLLVMDDERNGDVELARVPFGLDLTQFNLPSSTPENGDVTFSATLKVEHAPNSPTLFFFSHDVVVDWDDANDPRLSSFRLDIADEITHELKVGDEFNSSTDDSVLTITQLTQVDKVRHDDYNLVVSFDVTHRYLDDGLAGGNGTASDTSTVVLEILELAYSDRRGATANQAINVVNQAPTVALAPFDGEIGNGGVAVLFGELADPGTLDAITLSVDWGDGSIDTHLFGASDVAQLFSLGHVYATEGNFTIQARVTDDDTDVDQISLPVVVDFDSPPLAVDDDVTTTEDALVVINVLADNGNGVDSDDDGDLDPSLTENLTSPTSGTLEDLGDGVFFFDPNGQFEFLAEDESQAVSFEYQIEDSLGATDSATVTITMNGVNDAPTAMAINAGTNEDAGTFSLDLLVAANASDVDATDELSVSSLSLASGRVISFTQNGNNLEFDTNQFNDLAVGESETLVFDFSVSDDSVTANDTISRQATIVIDGRNDAPSVSASIALVVVNEGQTANQSGGLDDDDVTNNVTITASIGEITQDTGNGGAWAWSFDTADGPDDSQTVTVTATDSDDASTSTAFVLIVNNVAPVAVDDSNATSENQSVASDVIVNDTDAGADVLSLVLDSAAIATMTRDSDNVAIPLDTASISESGNQITFHPGTDFDFLAVGETATVVIGYTVTDDDAPPLTDAGALTITVTGTNDTPSVNANQSLVEVDEGGSATNAGSFADVDASDSVTITASVGGVTQGAGNSGTWAWSFDTTDGPDQSQTVVITADDGKGGIATTSFGLTVDNVAPSVAAVDGTVIVNEGDTATNSGTFSDPGDDVVTITASFGTITQIDTAGTWAWSFNTNDGPDQSQTVTVIATDSDGASTSTTFGLTVNNVAPSVAAADGTVIVNEGDTAANSGTFNDPGADVVTITASIGTVTQIDTTGTWAWSFNTNDGPDDSQTVTVTATDSDGASTSTTFGLTVNNVAPVAVADSNATSENQSLATDVIDNDTDVGDDILSLAPGSAALASMMRDSDNAAILFVTAEITESGNQITFDPGSDFDFLAVSETATVVINYTVTDDDALPLTDTGTLTITVEGTNDASIIDSASQSGTITETVDAAPAADADPTNATGTITFDDVDLSDSPTASISSSSVASTTLANSYALTAVQEADLLASLSLAAVSFSNVDGSGSLGWTYSITNAEIDFLGANDSVELTFVVTVDDGNGGTDTQDVVITVEGTNDVPYAVTIDAIGDGSSVFPIGEITFEGSFEDVDVNDTHKATWTLAHAVDTDPELDVDTVESELAVSVFGVGDPIDFDTDELGPGVYTVTLTIDDHNGGIAESAEEIFVVYDPSAGFVTGGGWIHSLEGNLVGSDASGKANFGFVSKYKKGASVPTGQTEFQFKAGDFNFHSSDYQWLVVAGARAQYKGTGTVNGEGSFGFMLTATDAQITGGGDDDKFRIKIWDIEVGDGEYAEVGDSGVVYDTQLIADDAVAPDTLISGNIIIHSGGKNLRADNPLLPATDGSLLTKERLDATVDNAISYWAIQGVKASHLEALHSIDVLSASLSGDLLGKASSSTNLIWIDRDAAGSGWSTESNKGYDLLSTVTHELGHMIGLDHDVLGASLEIGESQLSSLVSDSTQVRATDNLFGGRLESLSSSLERSISRRSVRGDILAEESQVEPGMARNSIDQILFGLEEAWSVDEIFSEEEGDDSDENWLEDILPVQHDSDDNSLLVLAK